MLIVDGARYKPWTPKDEERDFHPLVKAQSKEIFGKDSVYFDVKTTIKTASGIGSIPDAYVIDLAEPCEWYVVENELSTHPVYEHIVKQLSKFINGIENQNSRTQILELLYDEINKDSALRAIVLAKTKSVDVYRFLSKLLSKTPKIVVIIDEKTPDVEEACQALKYAPEIVEFRTFVAENKPGNYAHLFDPLNIANEETSQSKEAITKVSTTKISGWEEWLAWTNEPTKVIVRELHLEISNLFPDLISKPLGNYFAYYRAKAGTKTRFVALILNKNNITVRIRVDPSNFSDPKQMVGAKTYSWFFHHGKGEERSFKITSKEQIPYAMMLIKQSYELAK